MERSLQIHRAASVLHELARYAYAQMPSYNAWRTTERSDAQWTTLILGLKQKSFIDVPPDAWRDECINGTQFNPWKLRYDQLPPSMIVDSYMRQALFMINAIAQPDASIDKVAREGFRSMGDGPYDAASDSMKDHFRKIAKLVVHALGATDSVKCNDACD